MSQDWFRCLLPNQCVGVAKPVCAHVCSHSLVDSQKYRGSVSSSGWWECFAVTRWLRALKSVPSARFTARVLRYVPSAEHRPGPAPFLLLSLSHLWDSSKHIHCLFLCISVLAGWLSFFVPRFAMKMHKAHKFPDWMAMHMQVRTTYLNWVTRS